MKITFTFKLDYLFLFLLISSLLVVNLKVEGQVIYYDFIESSETYNEISAPFSVAYGSQNLLSGFDNHLAGSAHEADIGFSFNFDGLNYTQCFISTNGFIVFGGLQPLPALAAPLNNTAAFNGVACAFGTRLTADNGFIAYKTTGTSPNRIFTVQWKNSYRHSDAAKGIVDFQIKLYEIDNSVRFHYGPNAFSGGYGIGVQVGLRGPNRNFNEGNVNNRRQAGVVNVGDTWFLRSAGGTANNHTMLTSAVEFPDNSMYYEFILPPLCNYPSGSISDLQIGASGVSVNSFTNNSFSSGTSNATNFLVLRSTVNIPPSLSQITDRTFYNVNTDVDGIYRVVSISNATTFAQTGLTPNTTYYYWVIPYNSNCIGGPFYNLGGMIQGFNTTCIPAPTIITPTNIHGNGFTFGWSNVDGAVNYAIDVSLNFTFTNILPAYNGLLTGLTNTYTFNDLPPVTTYFVRVRAIGQGSCSIMSNFTVGTTLCGFFTIPFQQSFDTTTVGTVPICFNVANDNGDVSQWSVQSINPASAPRSIYLNTNTPTASNDWFFTSGLFLTGGQNYRLFYRVNTGGGGTLSERLRVRIGNGQSAAQMNITIQDLPNIINTVYQSEFVDFSVASTGVYFIGFQGYSIPNQSYIAIDDIFVDIAPTCFEPSDILVNSTDVSTATISFVAPDAIPVSGYDYYLSISTSEPSSVTPITGTIAFGSTNLNLTGLNSSTQYYLWIRGNCGVGDVSVWSLVTNFSTDCNPPVFTSISNGTRCGVGTVSLQAIPNSGSVTHWFDSPGGNSVGIGNNFITPVLSSTTTFYAVARAPGAIASVGPTKPSDIPGARTILNESIETNFSVSTQTTILSVDIYPLSSGQNGTMIIRNSFGVAVYALNFTTNSIGGSNPQTIPFNFVLEPGNYTLGLSTVPSSGLLSNIENVSYPYNSSVASINGNNFDNSFYVYYYNWKFTTTCFSELTAVTATLSSPPTLTISSANEIICSGDFTSNITLTGAGAYNNFTWSPGTNVSGNAASGFSFNPTESTTYTLTASQISGAQCVVTRTFNVTVNPSPPDIIIIPDTANLCENDIQTFSATFSDSSEINIFVENFEGDISEWSISNLSTGGNVLDAAWTLRSSPYTYSSSFWNITANSNDVSNFFFANSDAQGSPSSNRTRTYLTSPSFSLVGYTTASLGFWHYLLWSVGNFAQVQISLDDGLSWNVIASYTGIQGLASNFVNPSINLNAYVDNSNVRLRFYYDATWDYGWAIDNIRVSGTVSTAVNWSPVDDLYVDDLATIPYTAGTPAGTVYCMPTTDRTYTARVNTIDGCFSEATFSVGFSPQPVGGMIPSGENLCVGGTPANLTLTGHFGTIIRWERADDAAFTLNVTPIANTTDVLTPAEMGAITTVRYFRVVVGSGVCPLVYSNVAAISFPTSVWNGSVWSNGEPNATTQAVINVAGNATISNNIVACSLQVVSGNISVASGVTIQLQGTLNVSGGSLTFENEASLLQVDTTPNTGTIVYRRNSQPMWLYDYTYWSSPVAAQNVKQFSPNTNLIRFYTYQGGVNWVRVFPNQAAFDAGAATMTPGRGYIIRAPGSGVPQFYAFGDPSGPTVYPGVFTGVPNNGTYTAPINITASNIFNFVGNPYPSALDIHEFLLDPDNLGVIERTIYLWTHNTPITNNNYNAGDYATYNFMGGVSSDPGTGTPSPNPGVNTNAPTRYIASGQGFILYGLTNGTVSFKNSMRVAGNNNSFFRMAAPNQQTDTIESIEKYRLWLNMTNQTNLNQQLMVGFSDMASDGYDDGFDAKAPNSAYGLQFYSLHEDQPLSIQAKGLPFTTEQFFPIGFSTQEEGTYHVFLTQFDGFFDNRSVYLQDLWTGVIHDLKSNAYSFATESGVFNDRFRIRFNNETLGLDIPTIGSDILVVQTPGNLSVQAMQTTLKEIQLFDMTGRLILSRKAASGSMLEHLITTGIERQAVMLQITDENNRVYYRKTLLK